MRGAAAVADQIVVVERVEVEAPMLADEVAQAQTSDQTRIEATILRREAAFLVKGIVIHAIVCHPVGFALNAVLQPVAEIAADHGVAAEMFAAERKVSHNGQRQIEVVMFGVERIKVVEMAVHAVGAAHHAEVGTKGKPVGETVTGLNAHIIAA